MNINEILLSLPNKIALSFEEIYAVSKSDNLFYKLTYTGAHIRAEAPKTYEDFVNTANAFDPSLVSLVERNAEAKRLVNNTLVTVTSVDNFKFVLMMTLDKDYEAEKEEIPTEPEVVETVEETNELQVNDEGKDILLIADDSNIITNFFRKIFEDRYEILVAENGIEAKDLINEYKDKNLVGLFIDLQMPVMDGFELLEYLQNESLLDKLPTSIISGEDSAEGITKATDYNVVDMLQKPFSKEAAEAIVKKTIRFSPKYQ